MRAALRACRLGAFIGAMALAQNSAAAVTAQTNRAAEWTFTSTRTYPDPFHEVTLDAVFTAPDGTTLRVPAFWAGGQTWRVRYASAQIGLHRFRTECSDTANPSLHAAQGSLEVTPYRGDNPLFRRGPVRVAADKRHLAYADGTPFFWLGDTWWMGLSRRLHWPDEFKTLTADRRTKGFNVVQIVAGLYPDMAAFDERGANEAGFPWEKDYARIRPEYFDAADVRLGYLVDQGITPCIVGAWGYFLPWMGVPRMEQHWRYLIARYGAWPVVWCAAGEANLPWYLAKGFPYDDRQQVRGWTQVLRTIRKTDPFRRPLTIHPTAINQYTSRHATDDPSLLDFDMLQTPHGQREAVPVALQAMRHSTAAQPVMPVLDGEASYEMLGDSLPTRWTRTMFWVCMTSGAAGHTYGANGIWQCNRRGQPHGPSPHMPPGGTGYGVIPWDDAMNLPGSRQLGEAKKLFEQFEWWRFTPHPEWAAYENAGTSLARGEWIWFPEGDPAKAAPVATRYFRRRFDVPQTPKVARALLHLAADDRGTVFVNGREVGAHQDWQSPREFDVTSSLRPGQNLLAIAVENLPAPVKDNPAGLLCALTIEFAGGAEVVIASDAAWRCSQQAAADWTAPGFPDAAWPAAKSEAKYGQGPWGKLGAPDSMLVPLACGTAGQVRIIYLPLPMPAVVRQLEPKAAYRASYFNPASGQTTDIGAATADGQGSWRIPPRPAADPPDWVLVLQKSKD